MAVLPTLGSASPAGSWGRDVRSVSRERQSDEPGEGSDERVFPGPVAVDPEMQSSSASDQAGGDVQQPVAQLFGFGGGEGAVEEQHAGPGE